MAKRSSAWMHGSSLQQGLILNFNFGPSWANAPASYVSALATAQSIIQNAFPNVNATINIEIGYGFFDETDLGSTSPVGASSSVGADILAGTGSYSAIRAALAAIPNPSASLVALLNNTPAGTTLNGTTNFTVPGACCKALGLFGIGGPTSATDVRRDGCVGMGTGWGSNKLVGVFIHEITHAMGRETQVAPVIFSRFTSVGVRDFGNVSNSAYFSLDGGTVHIADYDTTGSDRSDFNGGGVQDGGVTTGITDCFDETQFNTPLQNLSTADIQLMNAMGFQ